MSKPLVIFRNEGLIDPRSIYTFGVSSKDNTNAIGFFGTGLKYAIAVLLRHKQEITIYIDGERYDFTTEKSRIRNDDFEIVHMNGQPLGFTTELGKTWELWMAFRELYCNTVDEHGIMSVFDPRSTYTYDIHAGETLVQVRGSEFKAVVDRMDEYFLPKREPIFSANGIEAYPGPSEYVYYQGIRAGKLGKFTYFTYNITNKIDLTEDRTIRYMCLVGAKIASAVGALTDHAAIRTMVTMEDAYYESGLDFSHVCPNTHFHDVVISLVRDFSYVNKSAAKVCQLSILDALADLRPANLNKIDEIKVAKAIDFCKRLGHDPSDYKIVITDYIGENILGRANGETIYLSTRVVMMGTKQIAATILEEYLHLRYKLVDETYAMQNFLFDVIIGLGEQIMEEPL